MVQDAFSRAGGQNASLPPGHQKGIGLRVYINEMGWIESGPGPTELCGSTLPPLFAEGIREP
jgi:hypothetical protein